MGWSFMTKGPHFDERREIEQLFRWSDDKDAQLLKLTKVGSLWFGAVRFANTDPKAGYIPDEDGSYTWLAVILTKHEGYEWGYKAMEESMGPQSGYAKCPPGILNMLSDTTSEYALRYREDCRKWAGRPKLKPGNVVRTSKPLSFGNGGVQIDTFKKMPTSLGRMVFDTQEVGLVRLRGEDLMGAEVLS